MTEPKIKELSCGCCGGRVWNIMLPEYDPATESEADYFKRASAHTRRMAQQHVEATKRLMAKVEAAP